MVGFWFGFSLTFVTITWMRVIVAKNQKGEDGSGIKPRSSIVARIAMSTFGLVGAFGAAGLMGSLRETHPEAAVALLVGVVLAVWHNYVLHGRTGFWGKVRKPNGT